MKIGFRVNTNTRMLVFAYDWDYFSWLPGEAESGKSSPAERFDAVSDEYVLYSFLFFTLFFARATP